MECCICTKDGAGISLSYEYSSMKICKTCNQAKNQINGGTPRLGYEYFAKLYQQRTIPSRTVPILLKIYPQIKEYFDPQQEQKEIEHQQYALSQTDFYEYDVVTIVNENHGLVDTGKMINILNEYAKKGWKLHTVYSNELGKNAVSLMGFGTNSTACEDVLIFERRIKSFSEEG